MPGSHLPTRIPVQRTEFGIACSGLSMAAPTSLAVISSGPPTAAEPKQQLKPLDHLRSVAADV